MTTPRETLAALRRSVAAMESMDGLHQGGRACLPLGEPLDGALAGGLACGALHEVFCGHRGVATAAVGFAAMVAALARGPVVWIRQDMAASETGALHGAGCAGLGLDPDRLVLVQARDGTGVLRAAEEALRHHAPRLVVAEPWGEPEVLDLTATRRLALRAAETGALALLLRPAAAPVPSAALTRWVVSAAPSASGRAHELGPPVLTLDLIRNRLGPLGRWTMEWDADARSFAPFLRAATPHRRLPAVPVHRPPPPRGEPLLGEERAATGQRIAG